jgi:hypothetical protein
MMDVVTECKDELTMEEAKEEVCNNIYGCDDSIVTINADYCIILIFFRPHVEISIRIRLSSKLWERMNYLYF